MSAFPWSCEIRGGDLGCPQKQVPSQAGAFALGMMIVMSSMGLYQPDLWNNTRSIRARLVIAFLLGFAITGLVLVSDALGLPEARRARRNHNDRALAGSAIVRAAFQKVDQSGRIQVARVVLGTGSRVMKLC